MEIKKIWFDHDYIYGMDAAGNTYKQSLLWYPKLREASDEERSEYQFGFDGIHWRDLDEDISFESFDYAEFAKQIGINATLLRNYINGFKAPSKERELQILRHVHAIGKQYAAANF